MVNLLVWLMAKKRNKVVTILLNLWRLFSPGKWNILEIIKKWFFCEFNLQMKSYNTVNKEVSKMCWNSLFIIFILK